MLQVVFASPPPKNVKVAKLLLLKAFQLKCNESLHYIQIELLHKIAAVLHLHPTHTLHCERHTASSNLLQLPFIKYKVSPHIQIPVVATGHLLRERYWKACHWLLTKLEASR